MKRSTARKRILTHLNDYRKRLARGDAVKLGDYSDYTACPLCIVARGSNKIECDGCLSWPTKNSGGCFGFIRHVDSLKTVRAKLRWIDKAEAELERWEAAS